MVTTEKDVHKDDEDGMRGIIRVLTKITFNGARCRCGGWPQRCYGARHPFSASR